MHGRKLVTTGTVATLVLVALMNGCGEATSGPTSVQPQDFAAALKLISGNTQTGPVGAALSEVLTVKVVDAGGQPVTGATVLWQVRSGGGTISPAASTSSVSGLASVVWTLGTTLGANKAVAILQGSYVLDSAVFTATAGVGPASRLTVVAGDSQSGSVAAALGQNLTVNVKDQYGYAVSGKKVVWAAGNFSGTVSPVGADTTDASGNANAKWVLGTSAIQQTASATITGLTPVSFTAMAKADTSRRLTIVSGGTPAAAMVGSALGAITVRLTDKYDNPISGASIVWNDSSYGGAATTKTADTTAADGTSSSTWTLGPRPGPQLVRIREAASGLRVTVNGTANVQFSDVVVGNFHACALSTAASVYCWGLNDVGQLGKGTTDATTAPTTVITITGDTGATATPLRVRQVTGSRSSVCALTTAQDVYCWGHQWGGTETSKIPKLITVKTAGGGGGPISMVYLQVAEDHGCFISTSGTANCTGVNDRGQLGDHQLTGPPFASPAASSWPYVDSLRPYSNLKLGTAFTCGFRRFGSQPVPALGSDSTQIPLCWGDGIAGQRGDSVTTNLGADSASKPKYIKVKSLAAGIAFDSASLAVGDQHACAVAVAPAAEVGKAYCWGLNAHGQLGRTTAGTGNAARDSVAGPVAGGIAFLRLFAGKYHTCGLTATGQAYCWGRNDYGQLGTGGRTSFNTGVSAPAAVATGLTFRSLSLGELFTCGVTGAPTNAVFGPSPGAGTVYCWGDNSFGQLGIGSASGGNAPVLTPAKVLYQP